MSRRVRGGKFVRLARGLFVLAATMAVAQPASADDGGFHPLDSLLRAMDLKTDAGQAPDFVEASRPKGETDFVPVGAPHRQGDIKVKSPAELKAAEAALDAARIRHDQISGRKPPEPKAAAAKKPAAPGSPPATQN